MRFPSWIVFLAIAAVATSGCALRIHSIGVDNPENPVSLPEGSKISVLKIPSKSTFEHDAALERKMAEILTGQGYEVTPSESADFFVLYDYRITGRKGQMKLELLTGGRQGMHTVRKGGPYTHVLDLRVVDAPLFRLNNYRDGMIWQGGAVMDDVPTNSPRFHDVILVAAFEHFCKNTGDAVTTRMSLNDAEARDLRD